MLIRLATRSEARACAGIVAAALLRDPVGVRAMPARHRRLQRLTSLYEAELRAGAFDQGVVEVAVVDDRIVGVAAWEPPSTRRRLGAVLRQAPRYVWAVGPAHVLTSVRALRTRRHARPVASHWLLADIAVAESVRGQGIGAALLHSRLDDGTDAVYLEATTPASRRLYERFGFRAQTAIDLAPGGYPVGMWRARPEAVARP